MDHELSALARFLARRDVCALAPDALGVAADLLVLVGSSLLITAEVAANALQCGATRTILVTGGIGHSTGDLRTAVSRCDDLKAIPTKQRSEAEILADVLSVRHGIPRESILTETESTNCGGNARETKRTLETHGLEPETLIIVQDPTMQLRTHASFERAWRGQRAPRFISFAPFVPVVKNGNLIPAGQWTFDRFVSLLLGEIPRLKDYGPKGSDFIEHVDIPDDVLAAHSKVAAWFGDTTR